MDKNVPSCIEKLQMFQLVKIYLMWVIKASSVILDSATLC